MKTLTEFDGFSLKNAHAKKRELVSAGKTAEELPQALGEALKIEGDRLTYILAALELTEAKPDGIKRVVVYAIEEGKSAPKGAIQKGEKYFLAEYFYTAQPKRGGRETRGGRDGGPRDKKRGRGKGGKGGPRGDRGPRSDRANRPELQAGEAATPGSSTENKRRPRSDRGERAPRPLPTVKPVTSEQPKEASNAETSSS